MVASFQAERRAEVTGRPSALLRSSPWVLALVIGRAQHRAAWPARLRPSLTSASRHVAGAFQGSMCAADQGGSGIIKAYSDELSQLTAGANGSHRMKEALAIINFDMMIGQTEKDTGRGKSGNPDDVLFRAFDEQGSVPRSNPSPVVKLTEVSVANLTGSFEEPLKGDITVAGEVTFAFADIIENGSAVDPATGDTIEYVNPTFPQTITTGSKYLIGAWRAQIVTDENTDFISNSQNITQILHFNTGVGWGKIRDKAIRLIQAIDKFNKGQATAAATKDEIIDIYRNELTQAKIDKINSYSPNLAVVAISSGLLGEDTKKVFDEAMMIGKLAMSFKANTGREPTMLDLFVAYDIASGEGFHLFGGDAFNDIIATEAGGLFGADENYLTTQLFFADTYQLSKNIEARFKEARNRFLNHTVLGERSVVLNAFFSLMMSTEEIELPGSQPKAKKIGFKFVPVKMEFDGQEYFIWAETIGTIVQRQIELHKITKTDDPTQVDPVKEKALLDRIEKILIDRNVSSYSGNDAELSQASVKSLYEMAEMYAFLTETAP